LRTSKTLLGEKPSLRGGGREGRGLDASKLDREGKFRARVVDIQLSKFWEGVEEGKEHPEQNDHLTSNTRHA